MKSKAMVVAAMAGMIVPAGSAKPKDPDAVIVYVEYGVAPLGDLTMAMKMAGKMFATASVPVVWHFGEPSSDERQGNRAIVITTSANTPVAQLPGALAYALPYEGVRIRIFYDRVTAIHAQVPHVVLAHVMVHEITHVLQGISRHSESGVMKANWTMKEYGEMLPKPLPFTDDDILLIRLGLAKRQ